jgi:hypothetical protein
VANVLLDLLRDMAMGLVADKAKDEVVPEVKRMYDEYTREPQQAITEGATMIDGYPSMSSGLPAETAPYNRKGMNAVDPQTLQEMLKMASQSQQSIAGGTPYEPVPADRVMTPEEEARQAAYNPSKPIDYTDMDERLQQRFRENEVDRAWNAENMQSVQDRVRQAGYATGTATTSPYKPSFDDSALFKEIDPKKAIEKKVTPEVIKDSGEAFALADAGRKQPDFFDKAGDYIKDKFGSERTWLNLASAFNTLRYQPDAALEAGIQKRLEALGTEQKANRTAAALRLKGTPSAIAAAEYIERTGDAKGGMKMAMEADQYVTGSGKEMEEQFGIKGLVANQPYRYNKLTKKVEGVGGGATNIYAVKPDKGYMLVPDAESGGVKQVPIPGGPAEEALKEREAGKETMTDIITDASNSIRSTMSGGLLPETGTIGSLLSYIGETDAAEVRRQVNVLKSQAQVETLNSMRRQSPTGGALGSVTERELSMLSAKAGALDPTADAKTFLAAVDDYQRTLYRIVHGREAGDKIFEAEMAKYGQSSQPQAATNGVTKAQDYFK